MKIFCPEVDYVDNLAYHSSLPMNVQVKAKNMYIVDQVRLF